MSNSNPEPPCPPSLLPRLQAEREKILRYLDDFKKMFPGAARAFEKQTKSE